ncbi:fimbrillin family protein [Segatella oris]|uniref:fimbrillin family protein n=1 Tax=Segatella oris TaxID=28135 RepID=UPI0028D3CDF5|nr:fimbrillin family protein [Segatella oris]
MKTIKNLAMLAVAALATAACSNDENLVTPTDHFPADGIIRVAADVTDPQTRAGMETNNLTMFQLRVQNPVNDTYSYNAQMKKDGDQWVSYKNDGSEKMMMLWQNKTQKVNVAAVCIPGVTLTDDNWKATGATPVNIMVEADQSKADKLNKSDLLAMKNHEFNPATELTTGGKMKVELKHRLAKLNLTVKLGTDFNLNGIGTTNNPITEVNVNGTNTKAAWTLITDEFSGLSEKKSVKPLQTSYTAGNADKQNAVAKYECILLPQTINANGFAVKIVIGGKLYTWKSGDKVTLTSNTQYNLTLTVGKDIVVIGSFTATPWTDGGTQNIETK